MCGISGPELIIIVLVALVVLGPERIPELMRSLGKMMREVRKFTGDLSQVTREIQSTVSMEDLRKQIRDELSMERDKIRRLAQEVEIDQIRERKKKKVDEAQSVELAKSESGGEASEHGPSSDIPAALPASDAVATSLEQNDVMVPRTQAGAAQVDPALSVDSAVRRATARARASAVAGVDDTPEDELPPLPSLRKPRGVVAQGEPTGAPDMDGENA
ncbi:MAG: twin-arginine translocase TatA/TatE family subunit [Myxococcales bacterium]|nr:twin-arginine translocase TatA/TatE family subunit [Myxococcales bacterium]